MKRNSLLLIVAFCLIASGCSAKQSNGLPDPTAALVEQSNGSDDSKTAESNDDINVTAGNGDEWMEEEKIEQLDLSNAVPFEIQEEADTTSYHEGIEVLYIEDPEALMEMFTSEALAPVREHLMHYTYNTEPGQIARITDHESIYVLCNKLNSLPEDYEPSDLREPAVPFSFSAQDMKRNMRDVAATALEELFKEAESEGLDLVAVSGYRSYSRQNSIYSYNVSTRGVEETDKVSSRPGHSEHQTGLAIDVSTASVGYGLEKTFGETPEGLWLKDHACDYGFIVRYTEKYIANTGYDYEPWHIRYIGKDMASFLYRYDVTLEMMYGTYLKSDE